jgi:hypothetical protein
MKQIEIKPKNLLRDVADYVVSVYYSYIKIGESPIFLAYIHTLIDLAIDCAQSPSLSKVRKIKRMVYNGLHHNHRTDHAC